MAPPPSAPLSSPLPPPASQSQSKAQFPIRLDLPTLLSLRRTFYPTHTQTPSIFSFNQVPDKMTTTSLSPPWPSSSSSSLPALRSAIQSTLTLTSANPTLVNMSMPALLATARLWDARIHDPLYLNAVRSQAGKGEEKNGEEEEEAENGEEDAGPGQSNPATESNDRDSEGDATMPPPNASMKVPGSVSDLALQSIYSMALVRFVGAFVDRDVRRSVKSSIKNLAVATTTNTTTAAVAAATIATAPAKTATTKPSNGEDSSSSNNHGSSNGNSNGSGLTSELTTTTTTPSLSLTGPNSTSMIAHALALGLPVEFVLVRHEAVHNEEGGPGLDVLRQRVGEALEWLWERWWKGIEGDERIVEMGIGVETGVGMGMDGEGREATGQKSKERWTDEELEGLGEEQLRGLVAGIIERERGGV